jgi:hypothetical protein
MTRYVVAYSTNRVLLSRQRTHLDHIPFSCRSIYNDGSNGTSTMPRREVGSMADSNQADREKVRLTTLSHGAG